MTGKFTVFAVKSIGADTMMPRLTGRADTTILTRRVGTKVDLDLTVAAHMSWFAVTVIIIHQLDTVQGARIGTRI